MNIELKTYRNDPQHPEMVGYELIDAEGASSGIYWFAAELVEKAGKDLLTHFLMKCTLQRNKDAHA